MHVSQEHLPHYTKKEYNRWSDNWEIIAGIPYDIGPSANRIHQHISKNIFTILNQSLESTDCNCSLYYELDLHLNEDTIVRPDLMLLCDKAIEEYPTSASLIVEILSDSTRIKDLNLKLKLYESYEVPYYIIVDPENKSIAIWKWQEGKYVECNETYLSFKDCSLSPDWNKVFVLN